MDRQTGLNVAMNIPALGTGVDSRIRRLDVRLVFEHDIWNPRREPHNQQTSVQPTISVLRVKDAE